MKKLYLIVDEWNNDRNFVGSELSVIKEYFDVTVICNGRNERLNNKDFVDDIRFVEYYKKTVSVKTLFYFFKCIADKAFYNELTWLRKEKFTVDKLSEIIRFYINGELFYSFLKKNRFVGADNDAIYYTYWYFWKCFALTKHRKELDNSKIITRVHGYDLYRDQIPTFYQPFKHYMDARLDKICFIAEYGREYYCNSFGIERHEKHILYKIGTKDFGIQKYCKTKTTNIVSCSKLIELKRVHLIIEALELIEDINVKWVHFGDGELKENLIANAKKKLNSKSNVEYRFEGRVPNTEIMKYYQDNSIDAFVMMSRSEGNPVSVIEAMSFGIPIIATNICNIPKLIMGNGIVISENPEPSELAVKICNFAKMSDTPIEMMRKKSREIWENEYEADTNNLLFVSNVLMRL